MSSKRIGGLVAIVIGVAIILLALYAKNRVRDVKANINKGSGLFSDNPVDRGISEALKKKVGEYDAPILWSFIGGFVLVIAGTTVMICCRKK